MITINRFKLRSFTRKIYVLQFGQQIKAVELDLSYLKCLKTKKSNVFVISKLCIKWHSKMDDFEYSK